MFLFLNINSRLNFLQFGCYGKYGEQRYRQQFEKKIDFIYFNKEITMTHGSGKYIIVFDPSYISKSDYLRMSKYQLSGHNKFWSGVAGNKKKSYLLFFSTDIEQDDLEILQFYKKRFQIEFTFIDSKQHTGLNDCQARSKNKLHFHFNAYLTAINLAKVEHWLSVPKDKRGLFSMADVKTMYHNALLLERFIEVFAVRSNKLKNNNNVKELINFGKIAV